MFDNLVNKKAMMILPVAAALTLTGCKDEDAASVPAPEPVDLAATEDLFAEPVQANPLTADPTAVVVRVNGEDITRGEVLELMNVAMQQLAGRVPPQQMQGLQDRMYQQIKNDLITKKLLDAAVAEANVEVTDAEIQEAIDAIKSQPLPGGMTFEDALAQQGTTLEEVKENIKADMATRKFLEEKTADIQDATDAEAQEYYDANPDRFVRQESATASHVLLSFDTSITNEVEIAAMKAEKKEQLEKIRADIIAGTTTFEEAASGHSDCPSKAQGGSLGQFGKGRMVPEFEVAAFTQEIDEVGDVIETQFGYHIIKVTDREEEGTVAFEEAKEQILAFLSQQKRGEAVQAFIKSLRDGATIEEIAD